MESTALCTFSAMDSMSSSEDKINGQFGSYLVNFGPFDLIFDLLFGENFLLIPSLV